MNKISLVFLLIFLAVHAHAQKNNNPIVFPVNDETKEVEFVKIIDLDSTSKKDIFNRSKLWVVDFFKSANDVIQYENIEDGKIVGKGNIKINSTGMGMNGTIHPTQAGIVSFNFEAASKDNKCRIKIYNIVHTAQYSGGAINNLKPECGGMTMAVKSWNSIQRLTIENLNSSLLGFESFMKKGKKANEDW